MALWAVATTLPLQEDKGTAELTRLSFECYLPRCRVKKRTLALFPGYFFFMVDSGWKRLFSDSVFCVRGVLMHEQVPRPIPAEVIDGLRAREVDGFIELPKAAEELCFQHGQLVRVKRGSLVGLHGLFDCYTGAERVRVLFEAMGRLAAVTMRSDEISSEVHEHQLSRARRKRLLNKRRRLSPPVTLNAVAA